MVPEDKGIYLVYRLGITIIEEIDELLSRDN
jgi:hypothetical protein